MDDFNIRSILDSLFEGGVLSREDARTVMGQLMDGALSQVQAAALLAALRTRGETVQEIIGFAEAMRERSIKIPVHGDAPLLDIVGTGGTGITTFNISTATIFVVAAAGGKVAKHGNRGVTRKSGSADVLEALGINLDISAEQIARAINEIGMAFIYARNHHPAMKFVAPVRADIKARTVFNSLGPLTNPAEAKRQLLGVYTPELLEPMAKVLAGLGVERALVVHSDGLDELTVSNTNYICEWRDGTCESYQLEPETLGLRRYPRDFLLGNTPSDNAATLETLFHPTSPADDSLAAKRDVVLLNAGAGLYLLDLATDIKTGIAMAQETLVSGAAQAKLAEYRTFSHKS